MRRLSMLALAAVALGCASVGGYTPAASESGDVTPRRDRTLIQSEEIQTVQALNLYEVVQRIHPEWLKTRTASTTGQRSGTTMSTDNEVQVYIDTQRAGTAEILKTMSVRSASSLKYYSASDAQVRFGSGNLSGAIQVITAMK